MIKNAFAEFAFTSGDESSLADLKVSYTVDEAVLKKSLAAFGERLADADRSIQAFKLNKDTLDGLETKAHNTEAQSKRSEEHVFLRR